MKIGIAARNERDAFASGRAIAEEAVSKGGLERTDLVLAFCHGGVDHEAFFHGMASVTGPNVPIVGGSTIGIISNELISYDGYPAGAALIQSEGFEFRIASAGDVHKNERRAGKQLAKKLAVQRDDRLLLVFYDSINIPPSEKSPPILNASTPILEGIGEGLGNPLPIIGAGLVGDYGMGPTFQFTGSEVERQCIVSVALSGNFNPYFNIMHGCTLLDGVYHKITRMEGSVVYELDNRPIVDIIDEFYGNREWRNETPIKQLTLGINHGPRYGEFKEKHYVNRLITGVLPDGEGICLFEPDFLQGEEIQFMLRDISMIQESVQKKPAELLAQIRKDGKKPAFGLYIDCAGRAAGYMNAPFEEAEEVRKTFNENHIPLLGFYSGVEIAPMLDRNRGLDWTGVLLVFAF